MSGTTRRTQGPRHGWPAPEAQHAQYGNQGDVDQITEGISDFSLQNPPYGPETSFQADPYTQGGQYYQGDTYSFAQEETYSAQEGTYAQTGQYPGDPQYPQDSQYGDGYTFEKADNSDEHNHQYTTSTAQQYSAQPSKGKSKINEAGPSNKSRSYRDRDKGKDREYPRQKGSSFKSHRQKSGRAYTEEESAQDYDVEPFYGRPYGKAPASTQANPEQETANLDYPQQAEAATVDASDDGSRYEGTDYTTTTAQHPSDQPLDYGDPTTQGDMSAYPYTEPYTSNDYSASRSSGHHRRRREDTRPQYQNPPPDPYQPEISDDLASAIASSDGYLAAGSSHIDDGSIDAYGDYTNPYEDGAGLATPRAATPQATIASTVGQAELDERFIVEHSSRFSPGEVFKVLWSEPLGSGRADMTDAETRSHLGQRFYVGIRRFIIVRTDEGHSTCVPILTYERRACTKRGVKPRTHGIIYPDGARPRLLDGEPKLGCQPVKIELDWPAERIVKESRVNYSKLVTVEHNIKVFFIGRIAPEDLFLVNESVDKCWEHKKDTPKDRDGRRHHRDYNTSYRTRR